MLETSFQRVTWDFQGCRFRISYFQIYMINYLFTFVYNRYIKYTNLKNRLETCFKRLTWGFQGCRFRISYFQIYMINYLFTFVYNRYIKSTNLKNMLETSFQLWSWVFWGCRFRIRIVFSDLYDKLIVNFRLQYLFKVNKFKK